MTRTELAAWRGMLRTTVRLRRELGRRLEAEHGLTMADYDMLVPLAERRDRRMRMADLADAILQPRSSVTRVADGLERRGFIRRERSSEDARGSYAVLTEDGLATFASAQRAHHASIRELFLDRIGPGHLAQLAAAWSAAERPASGAVSRSGRPSA